MWAQPHRGTSFTTLSKLARPRRRQFHDYFVTHLPSSSLHPDSKSLGGPHHKLPRDKSTPHVSRESRFSPAAAPHMGSHAASRETTVVRIPLKSAKHHFGASISRGERPHNQDTFQAGTIDIPAFAKRRPISLTHGAAADGQGARTNPESSTGDPQVFYFGVFDGHGGSECSDFLRERLHEYVEEGVREFELESTLKGDRKRGYIPGKTSADDPLDKAEQEEQNADGTVGGRRALDAIEMKPADSMQPVKTPNIESGEAIPSGADDETLPPKSAKSVTQSDNTGKAQELEQKILKAWRDLVGGYFRRFKPQFFSVTSGGQGQTLHGDLAKRNQPLNSNTSASDMDGVGLETVLSYSFLKADFDFIAAQVSKKDEDAVLSDRAINDDEFLDRPYWKRKHIGGSRRFKGGSTCSVALISTPTPSPFWTPAASSTLITAHVGDSRIILCPTSTGQAVPMTTNHHPSHSDEATRLRRFATSFITDSFGTTRMDGLANTRAFGDMASKRVGVSAEPQIQRLELAPAEYSFMVLVSDGVSGPLSDQEIVDIVKEARTPAQGAQDVVAFATEVAAEPDNATALVVRMGGWERRGEGGLGSLSTKEIREWKRKEAQDPRGRRM